MGVPFEEHVELPMPPGAAGWRCSCGAEWSVDDLECEQTHDRHRGNGLWEECRRLAKLVES